MRCSYCFYSDVAASRHKASMGIMSVEDATSIIKNTFSVLAAGDNITFAFQGGEPGLAGLDFFSLFISETKKAVASSKVRVNYAFQTNGMMVDDTWCAFFKRNDFLVGLSLDGYAALHNQNRMDSSGKGTFNRVMNAKKMFDQHGVRYNVLCVITSETARRAKRLWDFILREKIDYIQFIPCLEPLGETAEKWGAALTSERFYQFYSTLFHLWKKEALKGNIVNIGLFNDLTSLLEIGQRVTCGLSGRCTPQIIVEADGGVYPCDFYVLDAYRVGDLTKQTLKDVFESTAINSFINEMRHIPNLCDGCMHNHWCKGGCKRMARAVYGESCGMKLFLDECLQELLYIMKR